MTTSQFLADFGEIANILEQNTHIFVSGGCNL